MVPGHLDASSPLFPCEEGGSEEHCRSVCERWYHEPRPVGVGLSWRDGRQAKCRSALSTVCIDLRKVNEICPKGTFEPPSCDGCLCWLPDRPFRTTMDARWGFHQLKLHEETRKVFTLVAPFGTYCYSRMAMGWINATAEFQRHMNVAMGDAL